MNPDDMVALESLLRNIVNLAPALRSAELAMEILAARQHPGKPATSRDRVLAALIDDARFTVRWNGDECHLGATVLFRLLRRFVRSPNRYLPVQQLLDDVWGDERTGSAVRSAVWNLRTKLHEAGMADLAGAIRGQPGHYGIFLHGLAATGGLDRDWTGNGRPVDSPPP
jgi:DNA-binding response OmpR family regulator